MAAGILVKGPVLPVLAILTLAALCLWHRQIAWLFTLRLRSGIFLLLLLCLPWTILVTVATDGEFLLNAIRDDFLAKVKASQESHGAPPGVYALLLGLLIWPASPLLVWALANVRTFAASAETRFLLAWIIPFWFMIELTPTKLPHYPLPLFPAIILLLIGGVDWSSKPRIKSAKWQYFVGAVFRYLGVGTGLLLASVVLFVAFQWEKI